MAFAFNITLSFAAKDKPTLLNEDLAFFINNDEEGPGGGNGGDGDGDGEKTKPEDEPKPVPDPTPGAGTGTGNSVIHVNEEGEIEISAIEETPEGTKYFQLKITPKKNEEHPEIRMQYGTIFDNDRDHSSFEEPRVNIIKNDFETKINAVPIPDHPPAPKPEPKPTPAPIASVPDPIPSPPPTPTPPAISEPRNENDPEPYQWTFKEFEFDRFDLDAGENHKESSDKDSNVITAGGLIAQIPHRLRRKMAEAKTKIDANKSEIDEFKRRLNEALNEKNSIDDFDPNVANNSVGRDDGTSDAINRLKNEKAEMINNHKEELDKFRNNIENIRNVADKELKKRGYDPKNIKQFPPSPPILDLPKIEFPILAPTYPAFDKTPLLYQNWGNNVLSDLDQLVNNKDVPGFLGTVSAWAEVNKAISDLYTDRAGLSPMELKAYLDNLNRIQEYINKHVDPNGFVIDSFIPAEYKAAISDLEEVDDLGKILRFAFNTAAANGTLGPVVPGTTDPEVISRAVDKFLKLRKAGNDSDSFFTHLKLFTYYTSYNLGKQFETLGSMAGIGLAENITMLLLNFDKDGNVPTGEDKLSAVFDLALTYLTAGVKPTIKSAEYELTYNIAMIVINSVQQNEEKAEELAACIGEDVTTRPGQLVNDDPSYNNFPVGPWSKHASVHQMTPIQKMPATHYSHTSEGKVHSYVFYGDPSREIAEEMRKHFNLGTNDPIYVREVTIPPNIVEIRIGQNAAGFFLEKDGHIMIEILDNHNHVDWGETRKLD